MTSVTLMKFSFTLFLVILAYLNLPIFLKFITANPFSIIVGILILIIFFIGGKK